MMDELRGSTSANQTHKSQLQIVGSTIECLQPPQFDSVRGQPPVVPQTHAGAGATLQPPVRESVHLQWPQDGESVAVFFDSELIGFIARGQKRGFSRHIRVSGPFGSVLDRELFQRLFVQTP